MIKINQQGISLLEIVVVLGLLSVVMTVLGQLNLAYLKNISAGNLSLRAGALAAEGLEALRALKEEDWNNLANLALDTPFYLSFATTSARWSVSGQDPGPSDGIFRQSFVARQVLRDSSGRIVSSGGAPDLRTRRLEVTVSWTDKGMAKSTGLSTYLAKFK